MLKICCFYVENRPIFKTRKCQYQVENRACFKKVFKKRW